MNTTTIKLIVALLVGGGITAGGYAVYRHQIDIKIEAAAPVPPVVVYVPVPEKQEKMPAGDVRKIPYVRY